MSDALKSAEAAAAPVVAEASTIITRQVNAARQPLRNLIISKPFGAVITAFALGALIVGGLLHLVR